MAVALTTDGAGTTVRRAASSGLARPTRARGRAVEVVGGRSPGAIDPAPSETKVTAEVLEAGTDLVVVGPGRHRPRQRRRRRGHPPGRDGRQRAAVQRPLRRRARHGPAAGPGPQHPPGRRRAEGRGSGSASKWTGVELHGKILGVVGLGRVGALVAQRALAFGMRLVAYDPYVSPERARQMGVELDGPSTSWCETADFLTIHLPKTPETVGLIGQELLARPSPGCASSTPPGAASSTRTALAAAIARRPGRRGGPRRVRQGAHHRVAAVRARRRWSSRPTSARAPPRPRTRRATPSPSRSCWPWRGEFVPYAVNVSAPPRRRRRCGPSCPWPSAWAGSSPP